MATSRSDRPTIIDLDLKTDFLGAVADLGDETLQLIRSGSGVNRAASYFTRIRRGEDSLPFSDLELICAFLDGKVRRTFNRWDKPLVEADWLTLPFESFWSLCDKAFSTVGSLQAQAGRRRGVAFVLTQVTTRGGRRGIDDGEALFTDIARRDIGPERSFDISNSPDVDLGGAVIHGGGTFTLSLPVERPGAYRAWLFAVRDCLEDLVTDGVRPDAQVLKWSPSPATVVARLGADGLSRVVIRMANADLVTGHFVLRGFLAPVDGLEAPLLGAGPPPDDPHPIAATWAFLRRLESQGRGKAKDGVVRVSGRYRMV